VRSAFYGSERESGEVGILCGFLKSDEFSLEPGPRLHIQENGPNSSVRCGNDAPRSVWRSLNPEILARPRSLETRTERAFPHSHSDCGYAVPSFRKCQTRLYRGAVTDSRAEPILQTPTWWISGSPHPWPFAVHQVWFYLHARQRNAFPIACQQVCRALRG
jgi:hypothetical protein